MKKVTNTSVDPQLGWLLGGNPNAIENQEAQGQRELVESQQLPKKSNPYSELSALEQYKKMGIKVIGESKGDNLFVDVELPIGWRKQATDHSMWNHLVDDKGRKRAMFFYKAAFYDRDAFINFETRYKMKTDYEDKSTMAYVEDTATQERLFTTERIDRGNEDYYSKSEIAERKCREWLDQNFPDWKNINAYWD